MLKVLDVEGAVERHGTEWVRRAGSDWSYDAERYARGHRAAALRAGGDGDVRRRRALPHARAAGGARRPRPAGLRRCAVCAGPRFAEPPRAELVRAASAAPALEAARARGQEDGPGRGRGDAQARRGRARRGGPRARAAGRRRLGPGSCRPAGGGALRRRARRRGGRAPARVAGASGARLDHAPSPRTAAARSCRTSPQRLASALGLPYADAIERSEDRPPQREMANSAAAGGQRARRLRHQRPAPDGPCLLVDDLRFSGWTLAMLAGQLRRHGVPAVYPLALATRVLTQPACRGRARAGSSRVAERHESVRVPAAVPSADGPSPRRPSRACYGRPTTTTPTASSRASPRTGSSTTGAASSRAPEAIRGWSDAEFIGVEVTLAVTDVTTEAARRRSRPRSAAAASTGRAPSRSQSAASASPG